MYFSGAGNGYVGTLGSLSYLCSDVAGVCPHCLDPATVESVEIEEFNGDNWEAHIATTDIKKWSKEEQN